MHEMSLVCSLLDIVEEYAGRHGFSRVKSIRLSCGSLAGVEEKALRFAFEVASKGTRAEGASLELEVLPIVLRCLACGAEGVSEDFPSACRACGSSETVLAGGTEELRCEDLEVDEVERPCA
ncbi:MAG TPA: hydrogenase maturation nickel metallochaperone HypA [Deltaproteobacteria bacterium]|nr:hydrogenase maturation nickel metallochaperone HypA [Deltaproteobacteria bacterium]HPP80413.1 hydrogenase maturation nickel metallochaperone HypA [Deltaproteobacteria bacterium]